MQCGSVPSIPVAVLDLGILENQDFNFRLRIQLKCHFCVFHYICSLFSGPGTIFLMLVGAFVAAFKISNWISFYYNLIPIIVYMGVCLMAPSKWQLILSAILSTFYALVMMAVIVGTSLQLGEVRFLCFHRFFSIFLKNWISIRLRNFKDGGS